MGVTAAAVSTRATMTAAVVIAAVGGIGRATLLVLLAVRAQVRAGAITIRPALPAVRVRTGVTLPVRLVVRARVLVGDTTIRPDQPVVQGRTGATRPVRLVGLVRVRAGVTTTIRRGPLVVRARTGATRRVRPVVLEQVRVGATVTTIRRVRAAGRVRIGRTLPDHAVGLARRRIAGGTVITIAGATATVGAIATAGAIGIVIGTTVGMTTIGGAT
jgi:hypothetical protein